MYQCDSYSTSEQVRCCYPEGHSGEHFYSRHDETDRIRWKLAADQRDTLAARVAELEAQLEQVSALAAKWRDIQRNAADAAIARAEAAERERDAVLVDARRSLGPLFTSAENAAMLELMERETVEQITVWLHDNTDVEHLDELRAGAWRKKAGE